MPAIDDFKAKAAAAMGSSDVKMAGGRTKTRSKKLFNQYIYL